MGVLVILSHLGQIVSIGQMAFDLAVKLRETLLKSSGDFKIDIRKFEDTGLLSDDRTDQMIAEYRAHPPTQ
jgi:hypothetical protein